jgi:Glycosyltransferase 61
MNYYEVEDRGYVYIFHWFILMLGGLRHIDTTDRPAYISIPVLHTTPTYLQRIGNTSVDYTKIHGYHLESLEIIKDIFQYIQPTSGICIQKMKGEPLLGSDRVEDGTYIFLRDLFLSRLPSPEFNKSRYIYITRKNSHIRNSAHNGKATRQILNEEEILPGLQALGFEILQFEDIPLKKKIEYFQTSKLIVSPNSGGLTCSLFADKRSTIVEILPADGTNMDHYKNICSVLNIPFQRFTDVTVVGGAPTVGNSGWNMIINKESFLQWIKSLL